MNKKFFLIGLLAFQFLALNVFASCHAINPSIDNEVEFSSCLNKILTGQEDPNKHPRWMGKLLDWWDYWVNAEDYIKQKIDIYPDALEAEKTKKAKRLAFCQSMIEKVEKLCGHHYQYRPLLIEKKQQREQKKQQREEEIKRYADAQDIINKSKHKRRQPINTD